MTQPQLGVSCLPRVKVLSHFSLGADEDFTLVNHDVTFGRWMCSVEAAAFVLLQTLDVKRGQGLDWHLKKITVREAPMNTKELLFLAWTYS